MRDHHNKKVNKTTLGSAPCFSLAEYMAVEFRKIWAGMFDSRKRITTTLRIKTRWYHQRIKLIEK